MYFTPIFFIFFVLFTFSELRFVNAESKCKTQCEEEAEPSKCFTWDMTWYSGNVVSAFNQRVITAAHIGEWKKRRGKPIFDPTRVKALLEAIAKWNRGPLDDASIKDFFGLVINRTTLYEEQAVDHPPKFACTFIYNCSRGYDTDCKETCSVDDENLNCWRDDINVYTKSLLVSINQMAALEARLAKALVDEGKSPVSDEDVDKRIRYATKVNGGPLPNGYVSDVFDRIFEMTREYAKNSSSSSSSSSSLAEFDCAISPSCRSAATRRSSSFSASHLSILCLAILLSGRFASATMV